MKEVIATSAAPAAVGPYSQGVKAGGFVYVSGQLPMDPATKTMPEGIRALTKQCLENCRTVLEAAGSSLEKVVKVTVLMQDLSDFAEMNEVYAEYFPSSPPARAAFQVARLPLDARLEIEMVALA
ncbi:MAG: RidA family protein [Desulfovibrionaceae bacterium]|jgi:2-iminobutanoate/2-iminopropanoate deaminase|nr:RidA family protein [Desulfovibrionaceae bacterium]